MSACTANQAPGSARPGTRQTTTPAATATVTPTVAAAASPPGGAPGTTTAGTPTGAIQYLVITSAEKSELTAAYATTYAAGLRIPVSDLGAPAVVSGSVYYAYDPATDTYWAMADFEPTAAFSDQTAYMDGTSRGLFKQVGAGAWQVMIPINPDVCDELRFFPMAVFTAWSLPTAAPGVC